MLKDIVVLEVNSKKELLGQIEIDTPNEFIFANTTEQILNCHIFEEFVDEVFMVMTEEIAYEVDGKIDNVYVTFIDENDEFVCSIILDKLKPKRRTYRLRVNDWQSSGYVFKYVEDDNFLQS